MAIFWKAVEQYFTVVLFVVQVYQVCNFGKFIIFGLGSVKRVILGVKTCEAHVRQREQRGLNIEEKNNSSCTTKKKHHRF